MNSLIKSLTVLALGGGMFLGSAVAGPGSAYPFFGYEPVKRTKSTQSTATRACSGDGAEATVKIIPNPNPKTQTTGAIRVIVSKP